LKINKILNKNKFFMKFNKNKKICCKIKIKAKNNLMFKWKKIGVNK